MRFLLPMLLGPLLGLGIAAQPASAQAQTSPDDYFQQQVDYHIQVRLDDEKHLLRGQLTFEYTNNSPDTLHSIWLHLWPNAYSSNRTAFAKQQARLGKTKFLEASPEDRGYIDSLDFTGGKSKAALLPHRKHPDIARLVPVSAIKPGQTRSFSSPFKVKLPRSFSRMGGSKAGYQITQWYPKPAVYDDQGWHKMPYLEIGEFYSEFGNYRVEITLPKNYLVAGTGTLQTEAEKQFRKEKLVETTRKLDQDAYQEGKRLDTVPPSAEQRKTVVFQAENVHDFAWFADKRYQLRKSEVTLPHSGRTVETYAFFQPSVAGTWKNATTYLDSALYYYSLWNGDYPYPKATAVRGALKAGGGMEYPMVTVIGPSADNSDHLLDEVITHEVGHNWFYGILASNERRFPFLDEGINSANEIRYMKKRYPNKALMSGPAGDFLGVGDLHHTHSHFLTWQILASYGGDRAVTHPATFYTKLGYGANIYMKTAVIFEYLRYYLGDSAYNKAFHHYYQQNQFRHVQPKQLREALETSTGKNLDWLFEGLLDSRKRMDYGIAAADPKAGTLTLKNQGQIAAPVWVHLRKNDQTVKSFWVEGFEGKQQVDLPQADFDQIALDPNQHAPEIHRDNNYWSPGPFPKWEPLKPRFLGRYQSGEENRLFMAPYLGGNTTDKFTPGLMLYNSLAPLKRFNYTLAAAAATGTGKLVGFAKANQQFFPAKVFRRVNLFGSGKALGGWFAGTIGLEADLMRLRSQKGPNQKIGLEWNFRSRREPAATTALDDADSTTRADIFEDEFQFGEAYYQLDWNRGRSKHQLRLSAQSNFESWHRAFGRYQFQFLYWDDEAMRLEAVGGLADLSPGSMPATQLSADGGFDLGMDYMLPDRAGISSWLDAYDYQMLPNGGQFRGQSNLFAREAFYTLGLTVDVPASKVVVLYGDIADGHQASTLESPQRDFYTSAGLGLEVANGRLGIYFPLLGNFYEEGHPADYKDFTRSIRFKLNAPFDLLKEGLRQSIIYK